MSVPKYKPTTEQFQFGPWTLTVVKSHILASEGTDRERFEASLRLPSLPEMIFDKNVLRIEHEDGFGLEYNARDALAQVDPDHDTIKVANAQEWAEARSDCEHIVKVVNPFDWTFTTDYKGTLLGRTPQSKLQVQETTEQINVEKLQARDKIHFYTDLLLFEDELHDNGCSILSVKMRVMPTFFFVLLRLYMRVDNVLIRINDTRVFHEAGTNYILREHTARESKISELRVPDHLITDQNEIWNKVKVKSEVLQKLQFPNLPSEGSGNASTSEVEQTKSQEQTAQNEGTTDR